MNWDIVFLAGHYPPEYRFTDRHYFMCDVSESHADLLKTHTSELQGMAAFFNDVGTKNLTAIGISVEAETEADALETAKHHLGGFFDGLAVLVDRNLPKLCSLVQIRKAPEQEIRTNSPRESIATTSLRRASTVKVERSAASNTLTARSEP